MTYWNKRRQLDVRKLKINKAGLVQNTMTQIWPDNIRYK